MVSGTKTHAEALRDEVAAVLAPMGLRLSEEKTTIATSTRASTSSAGASSVRPSEERTKRAVYTYPSKKAWPPSWTRCGRSPAGQRTTLANLLRRLNPVLRGWTNYFRHGVSSSDLRLPRPLHLAAGRRMAAAKASPDELEVVRRRYLPGWWPERDGVNCSTRGGTDHPLSLSGRTDPLTMGE